MSTAEGETTTEMVDWQLATGVARKLLRPGPAVSRAEADQVVAELRQFAAESEGHVREFTGLQATSATAPVMIVDRPGWVQANADGFRTVLQPLADKLREKADRMPGLSSAVGSRVTGIEAGALLAFLSSRVLGQFDPFYPAQPDPDRPGLTGRLLLVAPNVMHVESELGVVPRDFRLWVCLHEETHRVQFTAVPWMREHLQSLMGEIVGYLETDPGRLLSEGLSRVGELVSGKSDGRLIDLVSTPEQKQVIDKLVEGTGGAIFSIEEPSVAAKAICDELRKNRYVVSYIPSSAPFGEARSLLVLGDEGLTDVRAGVANPRDLQELAVREPTDAHLLLQRRARRGEPVHQEIPLLEVGQQRLADHRHDEDAAQHQRADGRVRGARCADDAREEPAVPVLEPADER